MSLVLTLLLNTKWLRIYGCEATKKKHIEEFDEAITRRIDDLILITGQQTLSKYKRYNLFFVYTNNFRKEEEEKTFDKRLY